MGRKVDRQKPDKSASSGHHEHTEDGSKSPEPYVCTGKFQEDFNELSARANLYYTPPIAVRAKRPGTPPPPPEAKPDKGGKERGKKGTETVVAPPPEPETLTEDGEPPEPPPKTYVIKERFEYFKPSIQVEMDHPEKHDTVTEVFVRGWKIDDTMMNIFRQCFPSMERLHSINFWNAGLTEETLRLLGTFLPSCANVKTLFIEGNTPAIKAENYQVLLREDSLLLNLSLRHNGITDLGAKNIATMLGNFKSSNSKLTSLNLAGNSIGDAGGKAIAEALKMNRTLLSLSLAQNHLTDVGAKDLAQALKFFPLTHEQIVERRKLKSEKGGGLDGGKSPPQSRRADSKDRPGSHRSNSHLGTRDKRDKSSKKKDDKNETKGTVKGGKVKEADKTQGGKKDGTKGGKAATAETTKATKGKDKKGGKGQTKGNTPNEPEPEASDIVHPLLETTEIIEDQLCIPGNRILINLNLQRNRIGAEGINAFKKAIQYQDTILSETPKGQGTGLMRLIINRNILAASSDEMRSLTEVMLRKDPFYKPSATPDPDQEASAEKAR
ncbi:leucine-rich repeat-containing protein 71-like isoform X2 [Watersipora subatra]|uniref:leucine-rich repeat-containing protein 71-like isoform X2 n=1 Tax=Watersipora subatra TaxID=2589382 RepID=UPI00355AD83D